MGSIATLAFVRAAVGPGGQQSRRGFQYLLRLLPLRRRLSHLEAPASSTMRTTASVVLSCLTDTEVELCRGVSPAFEAQIARWSKEPEPFSQSCPAVGRCLAPEGLPCVCNLPRLPAATLDQVYSNVLRRREQRRAPPPRPSRPLPLPPPGLVGWNYSATVRQQSEPPIIHGEEQEKGAGTGEVLVSLEK